MAGVYWKGADGHTYAKASDFQGVKDVTHVLNDASNPWIDIINGYQKIADPNAPRHAAVAAPVDTGPAPKPINQAGIDNTQNTIDEIPGLLRDALAAEATSHSNTVGGFDAAETGQRKTYEGSTVTNQQNYDANFMDSIRAGIHGLGGLMNLLRGTGAGGGTAESLARDAVGGTTASDIRGGADTQKENQSALDASLSTFLTDLKTKRTAADDTFANNESAIRRDSNTQLQDLFGKMAGYYGDVGDTSNADSWMNRAGALTHDIAKNSRTKVSPYDTSPVVIHAPNLTAFNGPTQPNVLAPPSDGQVGSGIFTMSDPRRRKDPNQAPVAAPVGV